MIGIFLRINRN